MAVTRIKNNQITDAVNGNTQPGINAAAKLQNYSITSTKIANSLVYGSDLTVSGNLTVNGTTTTIDTVNTLIEDPILTLADGQTSGSPTVDIGLLGLRGSQNSSFLGWNEANTQFAAVLSNTTSSNTTVNINSYADFKAATIYATANLSVAGNIIGAANFTGNVTAGNLLTSGVVSASGTVTGGNLATGGTISSTGTATLGNVDTGGTVSATGTVTGGNVATSGTISSTGTATLGNVETGGTISATGNLVAGNVSTAGNVTASYFIGNISGNIDAAGSNTEIQFNGPGDLLTANANFTYDYATNLMTVNGGNISAGNISTSGAGGAISGTGNITGGNLLTGGLVSATGNATAGNVLTGGIVSATGNITGANVNTGNISLSGNVISALNVTGNIEGANILTGGLISATGNATAGNLLTGGLVSATGNITGANVNTGNISLSGNVISALNVTGNIEGANILTGGLVSATANITGGNLLTGGIVSATGTATAGNLATGGTVSASGNVTGANILTGGLISASGNITSATNVNTPNVFGASGLLVSTSGNANINLEPAGTGNIVVNNRYINGLQLTPLQDGDAASKYYVDTIATTGLTFHEAVFATTNTTLATATGGTISYTQPNGVSNGIGAYISTTGTFTTIDTANVQTVGTRILVKNEANAVLNGVYTYTNATSITRSTDTDEYGSNSAESFSINDYFFTTNGNINAGAAFVVDAPSGVITFGTSNIEFAQFSSSQTYTANTSAGLVLVNQQFNAKVDNNTTAFDVGGNIIVKDGANLTTPNIGSATGTSLSVTGTVTAASTVGGVITGSSASVTGTVTAASTVGGVITGSSASVTGTVTAASTVGGVITGSSASVTGTVTAASTVGGVITGSSASVTGDVTGGNILTGGSISATGNATAGNLLTGGTVSATGTITGGNLATGGTISSTGTATLGNVDTSGTVSATGTITGGNVATGGTVSATGNITGANVNTGNISLSGNVISALNVTGNIEGANLLTSGLVSATGNATAGNLLTGGTVSATGTITGGNIATGGTVSSTGTATLGNVATGGTVSATANITGGNLLTGGLISATSTITGGNIATSGTVSSTGTATLGNVNTGGLISATGNITGGNIDTTGIATLGNIVISGDNITDTNGRVNFNTAVGDVDFAVNGLSANVFYVDAGTNTASFGSSTQTTNAIVAFNSTNSILLPTGTLGERPATGVTGMVRFNTTNNSLEIYDNAEWSPVGATVFTVIADEQFNGDGSTVAFTLGSSQTTNSCIVSINGVVQVPGSAYSVSGTDPTCVLTFTEAPAAGDLIDVREITTTTTVTAVANNSGNAEISGNATTAQLDVLGNLVPTANVTYSLGTATNYWKSLYVGGNTIYLGGLQLQSAVGNVFTVTTDGSTPASVDLTVSTTGNITVGNIVNAGGNGTGNIGSASTYFNTVFAKATSAQYADLAEKYEADAEYAPGTVVSFGGDKEVTQSAKDADRAVAGVISTNPSYIMNGTLEAEHVAVVAFTGRVPTSVTGTVSKGDLMVSNGDGTARAEADPKAGSIIGKALENFAGGTGTIEVVIGRF